MPPAQPDTTGALNPDLLRDRISETFSGGYMTLLAIIQGVALGTLVTTLYSRISSGEVSRASGLSAANLALQATGTVIAIVIVTEQYFLFVRLVRWEPTIFDTLAPYALGLGEVGEAAFLGKNEYWWGSAAVLLLVLAASMAFGYTWLRISKDVFGSLWKIYRPFKHSVRRQAIASLTLGLGSLVLCATSLPNSWLAIPARYNWIYPACTAASIIGAMLVRRFALYGTKRWTLRSGVRERINERLTRPQSL
jgi:hypothetical protein